MKRTLIFVLVFSLFFSCAEDPKLAGLWELKDVSVDMIPRESKPIFLKFEEGGSFSVSRAQGDLVGLYELSGNDLFLQSKDQKWFNTNWSAHVYHGELVLKGLEYGYRTTELRFRGADKFPTFDEFIEDINGTWELYKVGEEEIDNMLFVISEESYFITENDSTIEKGKVLIDSRHQKINFANEETTWNARFVWDELRLENKQMNITYRMRRLKK